MNILICDDQKDYLNLMEKKVRECYKDEMKMKLYTFTGSKQVKKSLNRTGYQLAYIEMKTEKNMGINIAKMILEKSPKCRIVFFSDKLIYIHEAYELGMYYYLKLPLCTKEFNKVLLRAIKDYKEEDVSFFIHTAESRNCILNTKNIKYIETYYYDLEIATMDKVFITDVKNREIIRPYILPRHFLQINQSVVVNMNEIDFMTERNVILKTREVFKIGVTRIKATHLKYDKYVRIQARKNH